MSKTFFVTGASGFVGRNLCGALRRSGHRVHAVVRTPDEDLEQIGVHTWQGDMAVPGDWTAGLRGVDVVIHCAGLAIFGNGPQYQAANVDLTRTVLAAATAEAPDLSRFVFVSTIGAVDRPPADRCGSPLTEASPAHPTSDYGRSKLEAERLVAQSGLPFTIVRPAMVVGRQMRMHSHMAVFVRWALSGSWKARLDWPGTFNVVSVDDLSAALVICAQHPQAVGETFFCAGDPVAVRDSLELATPGAARLPLGWAQRLVSLMPTLVPFGVKAMLLPALTASDAKLRALGWTPSSVGSPVLEIVDRERARRDPRCDPGGQTVITGAASGLGRALTDYLVGRRTHLLLIDRDTMRLEEIAREHPHCRVLSADLGDDVELQRILASPAWQEHPVTELYAVAGLGRRGSVLGLPVSDQTAAFKVNVVARLVLAHAALRSMTRRHFGRVLMVSSSSAFQPLPYMAAYAASNAALLSLTEAWTAELDEAVQVMVVCPGGMNTGFQKQASVKVHDGEALMDPRTVVLAIFRGLAARRTTLVLPLRSHAMAMFARVAPRMLVVRVWAHLMRRFR